MVEHATVAQRLATTCGRVSRTPIRLVLSAVGLSIVGLVWHAADPTHRVQAQANERILYTYSVKIVCATDGTIDFRGGGDTLGDTDTALADADLYQTAVNIFNPRSDVAELNARVILSHEPGGARRGGAFGDVRIADGDAIELDCEDFKNVVHDDRVPGGTGFLTFWSFTELDVVAVYSMIEKTRCNSGARTVIPGMASGTGCHGAGASLDVEYIRPRLQQLPN